MDLSTFALCEHGYSALFAERLAKQDISIIDIFFDDFLLLKHHDSLSKEINNAKKLIKSKPNIIYQLKFTPIESLQAVGLSTSNIKTLKNIGIDTIEQAKGLTLNELNTKVGRTKNALYKKLKTSLNQINRFTDSNLGYKLRILNTIKNNEGITFSDINREVKISNFYLEKFISYMIYENLIYKSFDNKYFINQDTISIKEILKINLKDIDILAQKLEGKTLEEIGAIYDLTRQRVKQRLNELVDSLPELLLEDKKYKKLFETYNFDMETFTYLYDEPKITYNYLKMSYNVGEKPIKNLIFQFKGEKYYWLLDKLRLFELHSGELAKKDKPTIFSQVIYLNRDKELSNSEIQNAYTTYIKENKLEEYSIDDVRGYADRFNSKLKCGNNKIRYYDIDVIDEFDKDFFREIFDVEDGIYSINKLFGDNIELMNEYDIRKGTELADFCNKLEIIDGTKAVKIVRLTEVQIGPKDKKEFIEDFIQNYANYHVKEISEIINEEYGLHVGSTQSFISQELSVYLDSDNIVRVDSTNQELVNPELLHGELVEEVYTLTQVNAILRKVTGKRIIVTKEFLAQFGYKMNGKLVLKEKYSNQREAIEGLIEEKEIFSTGNNDVFKEAIGYSTISNMVKNYRLFKLSPSRYITFTRLNKGGLNEDIIIDFITSVINFVKDNNIINFTYYYLVKEGFSHELMNKGFENIFYAELISTVVDFSTINTSQKIFSTNQNIKTLDQFLTFYLEENIILNIEEFSNKLLEEFGFSLEEYKIVNKLTDYGGFYSESLDKMYLNKEDYIEEVYG